MVELVLDPELLAPDKVVTRARLLSRREYDALVARGVFDDERIELLRGQLITHEPAGCAACRDEHADCAAPSPLA
jgi:hypothetical protein